MKRMHPLLLSSLFSFVLTGCVSSDDPEPSSQSQTTQATDEIVIQEPTAPSTRLACEDFEADADSGLFLSVLNLTSYPLYDVYRDSDELEPEALAPILPILLASAFDTALITRCTVDLFEANSCFGIATGSLEDDVLNWTVNSSTTITEVTVNDRAYSSGSIVLANADGEETTTQWTRAGDGTETYSKSDLTGKTYAFTEAPDCSGTASFIDFNDDGTPLIKTETAWTSPIDAVPSFTWELCNYDDGVENCSESQ